MKKITITINEKGIKKGQIEYSVDTDISTGGTEHEKFLAEMIQAFVQNTEGLTKMMFNSLLTGKKPGTKKETKKGGFKNVEKK